MRVIELWRYPVKSLQGVALGTVRLGVRQRIPRCVMVTRPQPGGIDRDLDVLRTIHRDREGLLSIGSTVAVPGRVSVGDELTA